MTDSQHARADSHVGVIAEHRIQRRAGCVDVAREGGAGAAARDERRERAGRCDALMRPDVLEMELAESGLELVSLEGVQRRYPALARIQTLVAPRSRQMARLAIELVDRFGGGAPLEWIVTCRRR